jgi:hypothetical protein
MGKENARTDVGALAEIKRMSNSDILCWLKYPFFVNRNRWEHDSEYVFPCTPRHMMPYT